MLTTAFAERLEVPLAIVDQLVHRGGAVEILTDRAPVDVDERPALGGAADVLFPWQRELSVSGGTLRLRGVERATGFGVHAFSRLTFEVPDGATAFRVTAGVLDETAAIPADASMSFAIELDGVSVVESDVVGVTDEPVVLRVDDLAGARRLTLVAGDGGDLDAGDRGVWASPTFLGLD